MLGGELGGEIGGELEARTACTALVDSLTWIEEEGRTRAVEEVLLGGENLSAQRGSLPSLAFSTS